MRATGLAVLAVGSNRTGPWGPPSATIAKALNRLQSNAVIIEAVAPLVQSLPMPGGGRQPSYINTVALIRAPLAPAALLRLCKSIERASGRRLGRHWGPRTLDLDLIAVGPRSPHWPARRAGMVTLPHPGAHRRAFVLGPLAVIAPAWHHPMLQRTARQLLERLPPGARREVATLRTLGPDDLLK